MAQVVFRAGAWVFVGLVTLISGALGERGLAGRAGRTGGVLPGPD